VKPLVKQVKLKLCVKITCLVSTMCLVQANRAGGVYLNKTCKAFILTVGEGKKEYSLRENFHITCPSCKV
jgi:hypothetical protein